MLSNNAQLLFLSIISVLDRLKLGSTPISDVSTQTISSFSG